MRLWKCHIDNFGKFTDFTVDFAENPCVFKEPNGWGKSTLAAFVKVMFYGFANEKKRGDTLERQRLRYKPWQGGSYGGELEFEAGGKRYLLNRTFGHKESEDTFALYDAVTNLKCDDFTVNIGEELFQINQESFLRTVYIAQNDCYAAATDSINAKIGNLADNLGDMNDYEKVQQVIKDLRNSLTPSRKTGSLKRQKAEIAELRDELRRVEAVEQSVAELEEKLQNCLDERREAQEQRESVSKEWELANREKALEAKRQHYESILGKLEEKRGAVDAELAGLGGSAPEREALQGMQERRRLMVQRESEAAANVLSPGEQAELERMRVRFAQGAPDKAELGRGQKLLAQMAELERTTAQKRLSGEESSEYERLRAGFEGQAPVSEADLEESLRLWGLYLDKKGGIGAKRAALSSMKHLAQNAEGQKRQKMQESRARRGSWRAVLWILALLAFAAGGFLLRAGQASAGASALEDGQAFVGTVLPGIVLLCVGAGLAVAAAVAGFRGKKSAGLDADIVEEQEEPDGILMLEREIAEDEAQMNRARDFVAEFLRGHESEAAVFEDDDYRVRDALYSLKNDLRRFRQLQAREQDYRNQGYEERLRRLREEAGEILLPYCAAGALPREELQQLFAELERDATAFSALELRDGKYKRAQEAVREQERKLRSFLEAHGQDAADMGDMDEGLQKISRSLQEYENDLRELDRLEAERQDFAADFDIRRFEQPRREGGESVEALKLRMDQLDERSAELWEHIHAYQGQLDERQQELDALQTQQDRLEELERAYDKDYAYYTNLGLVGEYLEKAKESLSARYIGPVLDSFRRNYELLAGESGEDFRMDANIHVTRRALGEQRETGAFSLGSQDLVNIVLRVALVEAMYQKEKPFLILDDSFVNLDEARLGTAGTFLRRIAEDYQVIYFTCHESRAL